MLTVDQKALKRKRCTNSVKWHGFATESSCMQPQSWISIRTNSSILYIQTNGGKDGPLIRLDWNDSLTTHQVTSHFKHWSTNYQNFLQNRQVLTIRFWQKSIQQ